MNIISIEKKWAGVISISFAKLDFKSMFGHCKENRKRKKKKEENKSTKVFFLEKCLIFTKIWTKDGRADHNLFLRATSAEIKSEYTAGS